MRGGRGCGSLAAVLVVAASLAGDGARAEEGAAAAWVFDVRVVRVEARDASVVEKGPAWADGGSHPIVSTAWPELLAALKERGTTLLALDRRITVVGAREAEVVETHMRTLQRFERRDQHNASFVSGAVETGTKAKLGPGDPLGYEVEVKWEIPAADPDVPLVALTRWKGTCASLDDGRTLVLVHRAQVPSGARDAPPVPVEVYAFVTGRRLP
jgi:hypothetical protein